MPKSAKNIYWAYTVYCRLAPSASALISYNFLLFVWMATVMNHILNGSRFSRWKWCSTVVQSPVVPITTQKAITRFCFSRVTQMTDWQRWLHCFSVYWGTVLVKWILLQFLSCNWWLLVNQNVRPDANYPWTGNEIVLTKIVSLGLKFFYKMDNESQIIYSLSASKEIKTELLAVRLQVLYIIIYNF